ncbi:endonuclease [Flavobacterium sp. GT3R68]|uniref:endonuclease n=1 Tax=Flavobacterium sp. GT3R68 TaxID=2594437 RepID=UPI000F86DC98|nr:endonuclease [Flavobacterium sp. GT3R68]RTY95152.1 T9SS type A sorting domain-containing protein [Flavobacterium sp. GSN2]TRW91106.1 T9SS type A sorting domain-containing protein [Flavobacterium sp. GT3R68]
MKKFYTLVLLTFCTITIAQIPSGYYNNATGSGYTLKTQLYTIIKGHTDRGYNGLWTTYSTSDRDNQYENDNTIIDLYSENPTGTDPYTFFYSTSQCGTYSVEGDCYNREHMIPQSVFNSLSPMVADAHFIPPTDGKVNGMRANYPHGMVTSPTYTSQNGGKLGPNSNSGIAAGYTGTVFEPINEFKGDIARMYFYFATRYENTVSGYSYAMFDGSSNKVFTTPFLNILLAWNTQDPVSAREIARNNAIYARQNNRNPYIDHPEYVQKVWNPTADTQAPTAPGSLVSISKTTSTISISWNTSTDNVAVTGYNIYVNSVLKATVTSLSYTITGLLSSTPYFIYVNAKDAVGNLSISSNTLTETTSSGTTATDLLFSEYIEGSSNNKALEIANLTGGAVSLSIYSIKKQTNGAGAWSTGLSLSGTLNSGSKFTIVNSLMASSCYATGSANISTAAGEMTFNGNDAVGLFKNGILIDIIGTFNGGTANFSADETLRRKSTVTAPSTTFNKATQWDVFTLDTCNNLGSRLSENIEENNLYFNDVRIYPNPSNGNFTIDFGKADSGSSIEIYSLFGQKVFEKNNTDNSSLSLSNLQKGIYLLRVTKDSKSITKKIIIN